MRIRIITLMTFTPGTRLLPLNIPAIRLSVTVPGLDGSGLRPRCIWTCTHGVWSLATPVSLADTCHLARCVVLRVRLARINIIGKLMTRGLRHCVPSPRSPPANCHSWADYGGGSWKAWCFIRRFGFLMSASGFALLTFNIGNPPGKRKVGGSAPAPSYPASDLRDAVTDELVLSNSHVCTVLQARHAEAAPRSHVAPRQALSFVAPQSLSSRPASTGDCRTPVV
jgi:hypothetical protein